MVKYNSRSEILIVDDSEMNRALLREILQDQYEILEAADGRRAVSALERFGDEIDLVLLDIVMPNMDGFEVLTYMNVRQWIDSVPVIMISSDKEDSSVERAYNLGVTDYISRPFDASVVRHRVANTIMLYGKQKKLVDLAAEQLYEREKSNEMMIDILSHIVESRNGESGLHVLHIHMLTEILLKQLRNEDKYSYLKEADIQNMSTASALHDIGKIGVPEEILNKPGKLTPAEFEIIKTHTTIGADMLKGLETYKDEPFMKMAHDICRWHHERYDGKGYPDGLKGDEIPIAAQVVALADVYDALTSERCYKKAFSHEKAIEMIKNGECGTFQPLLIKCLMDVEAQIPTALRENAKKSDDRKSLRSIMEMLKYNRDGVLESSLQSFESEQEKNRFFASHTGKIRFDYNAETRVATISDLSMKLLGFDKKMFEPYGEQQALAESEGVKLLAESLHNTTPENPEITLELLLNIRGELRWNKVIARSRWSADEPSRYIGAIGIMTDIHEEMLRRGEEAEGGELTRLMAQMSRVFDVVRLVDVQSCKVMSVDKNGKIKQGSKTCYSIWNKERRCTNCTSCRAYENKSSLIKFEKLGSDMYCIISKYVKDNNIECVLELAYKTDEEFKKSVEGKHIESEC